MKQFSFEERKILEKLLKEKMSMRERGRILEKSHSVILYELKHNKGKNTEYSAEFAQRLHEERQLKKGKKKKIENNEKLKLFIIEKLEQDQWSPEQISGKLKRFYQEKIGYVCIETIYAWIYSKEESHNRYYRHLRRHKPKRIHWHSRKKRVLIPDRISIHDRPEYINQKTEAGHWETDSVIFSHQKGILSVQVERKSKLLRFHKCPNKTAKETQKALEKSINSLPYYWFKSITFDNGTENVKHVELKKEYELETYFCDPYCSWQKGLVENTNMLLRQYFPRNTRLDYISDDDIKRIQNKLNNRPRKSLNFLSPIEFSALLEKNGSFKT